MTGHRHWGDMPWARCIVIGVTSGRRPPGALPMAAWGWRVPFATGAVLGLIALWIRRSMEESEVFEEHRTHTQALEIVEENVFVAVLKNWRTGLRVILMTAGLTVSYYIWSVTISSVAQNSFGYAPG